MKTTLRTGTLRTGIACLALAGTLGFAGTAAAADDTAGAPASDRATEVCERLDEIDGRMARHLEIIAERQAALAERRAQAEAAGHDRLVERIDRVSDRLAERALRVQDRIERLGTWADEHCATA